jgi:hypothetical protein
MASTTKNLEDLVKALLDQTTGRKLRQKFHEVPLVVMDDFGLGDWERALLFTMDRDFIISNTNGLADIIQNYQMVSDWPEQGEDWPVGPEWAWTPVPIPPAFTGETVAFGALNPGTAGPGGWTDPGPHGRGFEPTSVTLGTAGVELTLVGEGYLGRAEILFRKPPKAAGIEDPPPTLLKIAYVKEMHVANFRRIYLKTHPFDVTAAEGWISGHYEVLVRNEASLDYWLDAGLLFEVKAP